MVNNALRDANNPIQSAPTIQVERLPIEHRGYYHENEMTNSNSIMTRISE